VSSSSPQAATSIPSASAAIASNVTPLLVLMSSFRSEFRFDMWERQEGASRDQRRNT
jgi:hypothetical protein